VVVRLKTAPTSNAIKKNMLLAIRVNLWRA
jgi:hypothetical protein